MKIVRLEAEAFKRIRAVEITPTGAVVQISGANGSGKSSCLDAIAAVIGGEKLCPEVPIRRGEEKAHVTVDLGDLVVTRRWTAKGSYLEVAAKDGSVYKSPQKMLDALVGSLSFDPLSFTRLQPDKQLALLKQLAGVDVSDLDAEHRKAYEERTLVNREAERLKAQVPPPVAGDVPDVEESIEALLAAQEQSAEAKRANDAKRAELEKARAEVRALTARIAELEGELKTARDRQATLKEEGPRLAAEVKALQDPDVAALRERLKSVESRNALVRQKKARAATSAAAEAKRKEAVDLTAKIEQLAKARAERIASAKLPVEGLGFGDTGITLGGLPFEQASSAEQLRVSLAMGLALNPKLRVLLIRDGSLLDAKSLAMVGEMAAKANAQVWVETVATDSKVGIVIEDGQVAGAAPAPGPKAKPAEAMPPHDPVTGEVLPPATDDPF